MMQFFDANFPRLSTTFIVCATMALAHLIGHSDGTLLWRPMEQNEAMMALDANWVGSMGRQQRHQQKAFPLRQLLHASPSFRPTTPSVFSFSALAVCICRTLTKSIRLSLPHTRTLREKETTNDTANAAANARLALQTPSDDTTPSKGRCEWNVDQRARLIHFVKQFDIIWLPVGATDKSKISASRRAAFEQIRHHFLEDGFTVDDLASQWRNLKDIFYKRFKEMNRRIQMGESNAKPPWRFFDALSFLASNKAMDSNRREAFGDSLHEVDDDDGDDDGIEDNLSNFGLLDELNQPSAEEGILTLIKEVKQEQDEIEEEQRHPDQERVGWKNGTEETWRDQQRTTNETHSIGQKQQEIRDKMGRPINRRTKRKMNFGDRDAGSAEAKRAWAQQRSVPRRQMASIWDGFRQPVFSATFGSLPLQVRSSQHPKQRQCPNGATSAAHFSSNENAPSTSAETARAANSALPLPGVRPKTESAGADNDRFRYFGAFVESAVRDLFHQCPDIARRLLHSIYGMIAEHQMEATLMFGGDEGPMDAQALLDDLGIDGEGTIDGDESLCWMS